MKIALFQANFFLHSFGFHGLCTRKLEKITLHCLFSYRIAFAGQSLSPTLISFTLPEFLFPITLKALEATRCLYHPSIPPFFFLRFRLFSSFFRGDNIPSS